MNHADANEENLRTVKTARDEESINAAARAGFRPLVKPVIPSPEIQSKYAVIQSRSTGEIKVIGDYRYAINKDDMEVVIGFTDYYPHSFPSPFAAYLIPPDLEVGERVYLEDLIEDVVGSSWNQGDAYRLESSVAIWDGKDFTLEWEPGSDTQIMIG